MLVRTTSKFAALLLINIAVAFQNVRFDENSEKFCSGLDDWYSVYYEDVGLIAPSGQTHGIIATSDSCVMSNQQIFLAGSILEVIVFTKVPEHGLTVALVDENNDSLAAESTDSTGWSKIVLEIAVTTTARIILLGQKSEKQIVIVDSITYKTNEERVTANLADIFTYQDGFAYTNNPGNVTETVKPANTSETTSVVTNYTETEYTSGSNDNQTDFTSEFTNIPSATTEEPNGANEDDDGFWNWLSIGLVSVIVIAVLALVAIAAYNCGKMKAKPIIVHDFEPPPPVAMIPRVKEVSRLYS